MCFTFTLHRSFIGSLCLLQVSSVNIIITVKRYWMPWVLTTILPTLASTMCSMATFLFPATDLAQRLGKARTYKPKKKQSNISQCLWTCRHSSFWRHMTRRHMTYDHLQPLPGCCLVLLPPHHPCVMEVEQVLGFSGVGCFPLLCTPLHLASACVWQIHHRLCGPVIVIRSLVFLA